MKSPQRLRCGIWLGTKDTGGRWMIRVDKARVYVHRVAVALWQGVVLHSKQTAKQPTEFACFNADHLKPMRRKTADIKTVDKIPGKTVSTH
jgi:hypothetical protein